MNNKGADQNALMCRLICIFVVCIQESQVFSLQGSYMQAIKAHTSYGPCRDKTGIWGFAADKPAHPRRLISAFVIRLLESIISKLT